MKYVIANGRLKKVRTRPVTTCDGCGACCRHMGTPPGFAMFYPINEDGSDTLPDYAIDSEDHEIWLRLKAERPDVEAELRAYYDAVKDGRLLDRTSELPNVDAVLAEAKAGRLDVAIEELQKQVAAHPPEAAIPCLWYDGETRRCRYYDYRPSTCRDAIKPGDDACLATRKAFRVPLPVA
jgi:Fe-S-cluster containining protein